MSDDPAAPVAVEAKAWVAPRSAVRNFSALLASEFIGQAIAFFLGVYLARKLGVHGFGVWVYAATIISYLLILVDGGTDVWGQREVSIRPGSLRERVTDVAVTRMVLAGFAILVLLAIAIFSSTDRRLALIFGIPSLIALVAQTSWAHRGLESAAPAAANLIQRLMMAALVLTLIRSPDQAAQVTGWQGVTELVAALFLLSLLAPRLLARPNERFAARPALVLRAAWPLGASRALRGLPLAASAIVLGATWPEVEVGTFGAAARMAMLLLVISSVFTMVTFPALSRACLEGGETEERVAGAILRLFVTIFTPAIVGVIVLARPLIVAVFSDRYTAAVLPLQLMAVAFFIMGLTDSLRRVLQARHQQGLDLKLVAAATAIGLAGALLLIPKAGGAGAGWALVAGELVLVALVLRTIRRSGLRLSLVRAFVAPAVGAGIMAAAILLAHSSFLPLDVLVGVAVYAGTIWFKRRQILGDLHQLEPGASRDV